MTRAPRPSGTGTGSRIERLQPWIAALLSAAIHGLLLVLAMLSEPLTVSTPQGSAAGGRAIQVVYIDEPADSAEAERAPPASPTPRREPPPQPRPDPAEARRDATRLQTTPVPRAEDLPPPETAESKDAARPTPPAAAQASAVRPPRATGRPRHAWGQPPGMLQEEHAPVNAGPAPSPAVHQGRRYDASSGQPNLEVGGYQVLYDLMSEDRARAWREQGMTEVFLPLPGIRQYMVCPLETAIRRESGPCRLVEPDDPGLMDIGDARDVISMERVYRRGELVWRGPGAYR